MQIHSFHIPVMGTGFTIDTPLKVARYGISSVISLGDDKLIEKIRKHYCGLYEIEYVSIPESDPDHRARRVTEYLNFIAARVRKEIAAIKELPFEEGNELCKYFELLDDHSALKRKYLQMQKTHGGLRSRLEAWLRECVVAGSVDVNIMTKADRANAAGREYSDAMSALRGFAQSSLSASVVFSAGLNLHLFSYVSEFDDFFPNETGEFKKKVILKVSDFRSASVQAKVLAKKGVWVSEYRLESGLNCGGHAFPTEGYLFGPILEEFKLKKAELIRSLFPIYLESLREKGRSAPKEAPAARLTAQGGVGTSSEHRFLCRHFEVESVGWGSPFLLVPEATVVDDETLEKLIKAGEDDIYLSQASPLGVPFYNLRNSASEEARRQRILAGRPGSACRSKYLTFNTEFGEPLCVASTRYQKLKLDDLKEKNLPQGEYLQECNDVLEKACICRDLGDGALQKYGIIDEKKKLTPAICPGPNLAYFSRLCSLAEMVGHIYGRTDVIHPSVSRPHFLINELKLYVDYLKSRILKSCHDLAEKEAQSLREFRKNLFDGIEYYRSLAASLQEETEHSREKFIEDLASLQFQLEGLTLKEAVL